MDETISLLKRPQRWDSPYDPELSDEDVDRLLRVPEIGAVDASRFPDSVPLRGILKNDTRIQRYQPGDIVVRAGDYGSSAFLVLEGALQVVLSPPLSPRLLGRQGGSPKKSWLRLVREAWKTRRVPEVRDIRRYDRPQLRQQGGSDARVYIQDIPAVLDKHKTARLERGMVFGELAALGRVPRTATVVAETAVACLEIRWQGLRELRKFDENWRRRIDENYRKNALESHLSESPSLSRLAPDVLRKVADSTLFETYGKFDWNVSYKQMRESRQAVFEHEPVIAREGDYPDGMLMIRAGFARVSQRLGTSERTLTYLSKGDVFGLGELYHTWRSARDVTPLKTSLSAMGYLDVLRIPARILEEHVFPTMDPPEEYQARFADRPLDQDALLEWAVENRMINGTQAMVIDLDRCVRCDDCVRACAATHGGNPRFRRQGKVFDHWMITQACMHCIDPVCMIGCPTGAIHRNPSGGEVLINDQTCIGCGTCSNSCPYENILMVSVNDEKGRPIVDPANQDPIMKATKCDLAWDQPGSPPCVNACPHDALTRTDINALLSRSQPRSRKASR